MCHDFLLKITVLQSLSYLLKLEQRSLSFTLSPVAEDGEDDDLRVFDDSGDIKYLKEFSERTSTRSFFSEADGNI